MGYLDTNVVSIALPTIQRSLHLSVAGLEWTVSSQLLTLTGLLLVGGRLADAYGRRLLFTVGMAVFTASSLAAGLADNGSVLIASRTVQGIGGALLTPATLAIVMAAFTDLRERATAIGIWTACGAIGLAMGPVAGGLISQNLYWGWIFLINVPVGVLALAITRWAVSESKAPSASRSLDVAGLITSALSLLALTYALIEGAGAGWTSARIIAAFAIAAVAAALFITVEARTTEPMVDLTMFRVRQFSGGTVTQMIWTFGALGIYFYTSIYLQEIVGFSPTKAGLLFVPMAIALAVFASASASVARLIGGHRTVALALVMMLAGAVLILPFSVHAAFPSLLPIVLLLGAGMGLLSVPLTTSVLTATPQARGGIVSALLNDSREMAGLLGITVIGAVLRSKQDSALRAGSSPVHAFVEGYHSGVWATIAVLGLGVVVSYVTLRPARNTLSARQLFKPESAPSRIALGSQGKTMTRILITALPIEGHVRPLLPVATQLSEEGHDVVWYTGRKFQPLVTRSGARFIPIGMNLDFDESNVDVLQAMQEGKPGLNELKKIIGDLFIAPVAQYVKDLTPIMDDLDPDVIVTEHAFMASPMMAMKRGIPRVVISTGPLSTTSVDTAPFGTGLPPSSSRAGRLRNRALAWLTVHVLFRKQQQLAVKIANELDFTPPPAFLNDWGVHFADRYLLTTVPEFEYPHSDMPKNAEFVGAMLPRGSTDWSAPAWWADIAEARRAGRPVVVVTQGTANNSDLSYLVLPAIAALADQDMLVIATTCGADPEDVMPAAARPANLRLEAWIPFTELLPLADLLVTNGGYGGVQTALASGVPLVVAGLSEDKMEVNARVDWSGAGLSLRTQRPPVAKIRAGVHSVLTEDSYRKRASELKAAYLRYSGAPRAAEIVLEVARGRQTTRPLPEAQGAKQP
jgi:EmrB/QacA subfamily drug resistance transporter/MGT family glycosyltransferase